MVPKIPESLIIVDTNLDAEVEHCSRFVDSIDRGCNSPAGSRTPRATRPFFKRFWPEADKLGSLSAVARLRRSLRTLRPRRCKFDVCSDDASLVR